MIYTFTYLNDARYNIPFYIRTIVPGGMTCGLLTVGVSCVIL